MRRAGERGASHERDGNDREDGSNTSHERAFRGGSDQGYRRRFPVGVRPRPALGCRRNLHRTPCERTAASRVSRLAVSDPSRSADDGRHQIRDPAARPGTATDPLLDHLGRRPSRRAARHVRGPGAGQVRRPRAADRRERVRAPALGVRRPALHPGGDERGGGPQARVRQGRAGELRGHPPGVLGHQRPRQGPGHQRRVGVGELPVADHRLLRPRVLPRVRS